MLRDLGPVDSQISLSHALVPQTKVKRSAPVDLLALDRDAKDR